jgi:hypothetical protein
MKLEPWNFLDDWGMPIVDPKTQHTWQDLQEHDKGTEDTHATNVGLTNA